MAAGRNLDGKHNPDCPNCMPRIERLLLLGRFPNYTVRASEMGARFVARFMIHGQARCPDGGRPSWCAGAPTHSFPAVEFAFVHAGRVLLRIPRLVSIAIGVMTSFEIPLCLRITQGKFSLEARLWKCAGESH